MQSAPECPQDRTLPLFTLPLSINRLAVDPSTSTLIWSSAGHGKIRRSDLEGQNVQTISDGDTNAWSASGPWGLAPHLRPGCLSARVPSGMRRANDLGPATGVGRVFWSSWGRVSCCELSDGKVRDVVRGLVDPIGLALDARNNRIFWSDAKAGKVQCANLDGSRVCDVATGLAEPWGIALGPTHIFWTERRRGAIMSCSLRTGQVSDMPARSHCPLPVTQQPSPNPGSRPRTQPESPRHPAPLQSRALLSLGQRSILGSPPPPPSRSPSPPLTLAPPPSPPPSPTPGQRDHFGPQRARRHRRAQRAGGYARERRRPDPNAAPRRDGAAPRGGHPRRLPSPGRAKRRRHASPSGGHGCLRAGAQQAAHGGAQHAGHHAILWGHPRTHPGGRAARVSR